jgi:NAD(P)-dependent dehydrogenase (short-subunit alcohol dehydrogenase family)
VSVPPFVAPKRVLVTGASRGIGRAVALALVARGSAVAACGRDTAALDALVDDARRVGAASGGRIVPVVAELTHADDRERLVAEAAAALGGLDALVLAAGIVRHAVVGALTEADFEATLAANLVAPVMLAQAALPRLVDGGGLVFVGSNLARRPVPGTLAYAAAKAGLDAAARGLALELAPRGIRVNLVAPGAVDTEMLRGRDLDALAAVHPLGRIGRAEEIAAAVLALLDAPWTTGTTLVVDGGALLR